MYCAYVGLFTVAIILGLDRVTGDGRSFVRCGVPSRPMVSSTAFLIKHHSAAAVVCTAISTHDLQFKQLSDGENKQLQDHDCPHREACAPPTSPASPGAAAPGPLRPTQRPGGVYYFRDR